MFSMNTRWQRADGSWFTTSYPEKVDPSTLSDESRRDYHLMMAERKRKVASEPVSATVPLRLDHREVLRGKYAQLVQSRDAIIKLELRILLAKAELGETVSLQNQLEMVRDNHRLTYNEDVRLDFNLVLTNRR